VLNKKALIGIGIGAVAVGIFLLAVTNPNLRENKDTYFGFIETTSTFDCAKAWDEWVSQPRMTDNDSFQKLSHEERKKIEGQYGRIWDEFNANWCMTNHEEWQHRSADADGRLALIDIGNSPLLDWDEAIRDEIEYNVKFPDGAYQDWPR
jgi:hypothetical protein